MAPRTPHDGAAPARLRNALHGAVGWLRERGVPRARSVYTTLGLALTVALAMAAVALWAFVELADEVAEGETLALDRTVLRWIGARHGGWLDAAAVDVTSLGSTGAVVVVVLVAAAFLLKLGRRTDVLVLGAAQIGGLVLNGVLKVAYDRPRPDVFETLVVGPGTASFPSGHALHAAILFTVLAAILAQLHGSRRVRGAIYAVAVLAVTLVAASRVYLGVHYPSDVAAGVGVGYAWAMACVITGRLLEGAHRPDPG